MTTTPTTLEQLLAEYPEEDIAKLTAEATYEDDRVRTDVRAAVSVPTAINLFHHADAHPFVLDLALMRKYGPEWLVWEPEVLELRILKDFNARSISDLNVDKIQAVKTLHLVDTFWESWLVFVPCALALSGVSAEFRVLTALTVAQALIAVDIAEKLRTDLEYSLEVRKFLEVVHVHEGVLCPIAPLDDLVAVDTSLYDVDVDDVRAKWPGVKQSGKAPEGLTPVNVQLQRMLEAHSILEENRRQLSDQLPVIYDD